ncbi:unnamed protein product [Gongylonema pulchrum]|uniref:Uncharacterized protein n=1 Tax=Gongylonema pulchrum TaxID=637853 RepID=A0A183DH98_9BILA|nr:unnamed protein product [Gongylonema pulchrum]
MPLNFLQFYSKSLLDADNLSPERNIEGASHEIENGYPLVADLEQLRLQNEIRMSVESVIQEQAFLPVPLL